MIKHSIICMMGTSYLDLPQFSVIIVWTIQNMTEFGESNDALVGAFKSRQHPVDEAVAAMSIAVARTHLFVVQEVVVDAGGYPVIMIHSGLGIQLIVPQTNVQWLFVVDRHREYGIFVHRIGELECHSINCGRHHLLTVGDVGSIFNDGESFTTIGFDDGTYGVI